MGDAEQLKRRTRIIGRHEIEHGLDMYLTNWSYLRAIAVTEHTSHKAYPAGELTLGKRINFWILPNQGWFEASLSLLSSPHFYNMVVLRSIWVWFSISALILLWAPMMGIVYLVDRDPGKYRTGRMFRRLGAAMTRANPLWQFVITGNFPANMRNPYLVISNHQSVADIPVLSLLPWDMKWVGKKSVFSLPILGWMMRLSRDIPVDRTSVRSRAKVFIDSKDRLKHGVSVFIFPEGTRSPDGRIQPFSDGPFSLAIKHGVPILPIALDGTFNALPKKSWKFRVKSDIKIHVLDPVDVAGLGLKAPELRDHVRRQIVEKVASWRHVDVADVDSLLSQVNETDQVYAKGSGV